MDISEEPKVEALWTCPRCGREFGERGASHDCRGRDRAEYAATTLFSSSAPHVYDLFMRFAAMAASLGVVEIKVERTRIDFCDQMVFAIACAERDALLVGLIFCELENRPRFMSIEQQDDGSWLHMLRVAKPGDLDAELAGWLERAHREATAQDG